MPLDNFGDSFGASFTVQIAQDRTGIQNVCHHLSFPRRFFNAVVSGGPPAKRPRVSSTSLSETGSRIMRGPWRVTAMRVPGPMPRDSRISAGMTNWPFVLTVVIRFIAVLHYYTM